jgi:hypothetical protein
MTAADASTIASARAIIALSPLSSTLIPGPALGPEACP